MESTIYAGCICCNGVTAHCLCLFLQDLLSVLVNFHEDERLMDVIIR